MGAVDRAQLGTRLPTDLPPQRVNGRIRTREIATVSFIAVSYEDEALLQPKRAAEERAVAARMALRKGGGEEGGSAERVQGSVGMWAGVCGEIGWEVLKQMKWGWVERMGVRCTGSTLRLWL